MMCVGEWMVRVIEDGVFERTMRRLKWRRIMGTIPISDEDLDFGLEELIIVCGEGVIRVSFRKRGTGTGD